MENRIWIIRFADGTSGSYRGTKDGAAKIAELKKDLSLWRQLRGRGEVRT